MRLFFISLIGIAALSGCASFNLFGTGSPNKEIEFNYRTDDAGQAGIIQVFDMGGNTVVHMKNIEQRAPVFQTARSQNIPYQIIGENAVLEGTHDTFKVMTSNAFTWVHRVASASNKTEKEELFPLPKEPVVIKDDQDEIRQLRQEIAELRNLIAGMAKKRETEEPAETKEASTPSTVVVSFDNLSEKFDPPAELKKTLLAMAREAELIEITGYTDASKDTKYTRRYASGRAESAKQFLIKNGISRKIIRTDIVPAGGFLVENTTPANKRKNRRVEIVIH